MFYEICTTLDRSRKSLVLLAIDVLAMGGAFAAAVALTTAGRSAPLHAGEAVATLLAMITVGVTVTIRRGLHRIKLNAYEMQGLPGTAAVALGMGAAGGALHALHPGTLPPQIVVLQPMIFLILSVSARLGLRAFVLWIYRTGTARTRLLIYGAGQTGQQLVSALRTDDALTPVAFVDDNPTLQSLSVAGLAVHAPLQLAQLIRTERIDRVVLAMPSAGRPAQARIARRVRALGCEVQTLPSFAQLVLDEARETPAQRLELAQLLGPDRVEMDLPGSAEAYRGRSVLVTGAGGSIGAELCRQLLRAGPARLVLLDHSEPALHAIARELDDVAAGTEIVPVLGSVGQPGLAARALADNAVQVVLHAAAYKHVVLVEGNAAEGLRNNVLATRTMAAAARDAGVDRFILVSSDKAVRPAGLMGASKRLAELVVQDLAERPGDTRFSIVRFGNVIGSSGSVIPLFEEQIARGGPVTVTDPDVKRYFMTVTEAVRLVLLAGASARGGDVFVLDMGDPVPIRRLARQMIEGAGYTVRDAQTPDGDIAIEFTGLRDGEKLEEELLVGQDMLATPHPKILRAEERGLSELETASALLEIRKAVEAQDGAAAAAAARRWIDTCDLRTRAPDRAPASGPQPGPQPGPEPGIAAE